MRLLPALLACVASVAACKGKKASTMVTTDPADDRGGAVAEVNDDADETSGTAVLTHEGGDDAMRFGPIRFEFDATTLSDDARDELKRVANWLDTNKGRLTIEGHADSRGTTEYNVALGQRRAQVIADYLGRIGISASRLRTVSYGEERPAVDGDTEADWAQNRRGELIPER